MSEGDRIGKQGHETAKMCKGPESCRPGKTVKASRAAVGSEACKTFPKPSQVYPFISTANRSSNVEEPTVVRDLDGTYAKSRFTS